MYTYLAAVKAVEDLVLVREVVAEIVVVADLVTARLELECGQLLATEAAVVDSTDVYRRHGEELLEVEVVTTSTQVNTTAPSVESASNPAVQSPVSRRGPGKALAITGTHTEVAACCGSYGQFFSCARIQIQCGRPQRASPGMLCRGVDAAVCCGLSCRGRRCWLERRCRAGSGSCEMKGGHACASPCGCRSDTELFGSE